MSAVSRHLWTSVLILTALRAEWRVWNRGKTAVRALTVVPLSGR
jgi:hypothetical protein